MKLEELRLKLNSLSIYKKLLEDDLLKNIYDFVESILSNKLDLNGFAKCYNSISYTISKLIVKKSIKNHIIDLVLTDENPFSIACENTNYGEINSMLVKAASSDLKTLGLLSRISSSVLKEYALRNLCKQDFEAEVVKGFPDWDLATVGEINEKEEKCCRDFVYEPYITFKESIKELLYKGEWDNLTRELSEFYKASGTGIFSSFRAFIWERDGNVGSLKGIESPDGALLSDFIGYEAERAEIIRNTEQFLEGYSANNVLLYGDRGTGKSSTVKALVNEYYKKGLRIIEVPKNNLMDFPKILKQIKDRKQKFIIFIDDLAFEDDEENYTSLKAVLEGGLQSRPSNVVIYATSNRRHLIKEKFSDRLGLRSGNVDDEIRSQDTIQEKLSLADRFGITIVFSSPDKQKFLEIVEGIATKRGVCYDKEKLKREALKWEMWYNGRSPRTARQFVDWLEGNTKVVSS